MHAVMVGAGLRIALALRVRLCRGLGAGRARAALCLLFFAACMLRHADSGAGLPPLGGKGPLQSCPMPVAPLPADLPATETASAGAVPGAFSVSPTGEATYVIPIVVPPGRAGMEPHLSVAYDSAAGQDLLGVGMGLQGLSAITRCPANLAQDGFIHAVRYNAYDFFCLDGARLVQVGETFGPGGSMVREYRTFPDRFSKVVAHYPPSASWDAAHGPQFFEVFTKAGRTLSYGTTEDSRPLARHNVVASWWVAEEKDRHGNAVAYSYDNDLDPAGGYVAEHTPARIDYTSGPGQPATRSVRFDYQSTTLHSVYYRGGMKLRRSKLLSTIRTFGLGESLVRAYHFDYVVSPGTRGMLVDAVHECAGDGTCKPATRLGWSSHEAHGFTRHDIGTRMLAADKPTDVASQWLMADVNGDGLDDIVFTQSDPDDDATSLWYVALNTGGDYATPVLWARFPYPDGGPVVWTAVPFDYDQDGRADVFLDGPNLSWDTYKVLRAQPGGGFELIDTGISRRPRVSIDPWEVNKDAAHGFSRLGDVNGDGVADLILCDNPALDVDGATPQAADGHARWSVNLWSPDGAAPGVPGLERTAIPIDALNGVPCAAGIANMYVADVDGDGKAEILTWNVNDLSQFYAYAYEGGGAWTSRPTGISMPDPQEIYTRLHFLDLNGDGLTDAVVTGQNQACIVCDADGVCRIARGCTDPVQDGPWGSDLPRKWMNTGDGYSNVSPTLPYSGTYAGTPSDWTDWFGDKALTIDFYGRGQMDLMMPIYGHCAPGDVDDACWVVMTPLADQSDGSGYLDLIDTHIGFPTPTSEDDADPPAWYLPKVTDADGDGRQDFLVVDPHDAGHFVLFHNDAPQDLLVSVTTGTNPLDRGDPGFLPDVSIAYGTLIDFDTTGGTPTWEPALYERVTYNPRSDPANGCAYPRACVVGNERVVSKVVYNDGANAPRTFDYHYRDGRYHRLGRGFLGFGERIVLDEDTGGGTAELYDNETFDPKLQVFPFAGQVARAWSWQPVQATQAAPTTVELTYTRVEREEAPPDIGPTYFTLPRSTVVTREEGAYQASSSPTLLDYVAATEVAPATVLGRSHHAISMHDTYGNVWGESMTVDGADAATTTTRTFLTDPASWQIAFVALETTCSTSASLGQTQCRSAAYVPDAYDDVASAQTGDPADPETQLSVTYGRDLYGNLVSTAADDAYGHHRASCTGYDEDFTLPARHRDAAGHVSLIRIDPGLGVPTAAADPNGLVVQWAHDGFGRVTEELRPDGTTTTTTIDRDKHGGPAGQWWEIVMQTAAEGGGRRTTHVDALGRAVRTSAKGPDVTACDAWLCMSEPWYEQEAHYDHLGRLDRVSQTHLAGDPASAVLYDRVDHDAAGRTTRHTSPSGTITTYAYAGLMTSATDSTGTASTLVDALGRVTETFDKEQNTTQYAYGPFGVVWLVVGPDGSETITLPDSYGRVRDALDPDRGESVTHHDGFGEITGGADARGWSYTLTHDALGRLVQRDDHDGTTTWVYDTAPNGVGRIASVTSPTGNVEAYGYNAVSRPASVALTVEGETFASTFTYDGFGRLQLVAYPQTGDVEPLVVRYDRDTSGNVVAVRDNGSGATFYRVDQVEGAGRATVESLADGVTKTQHVYDAATGAVTAIVTERGKQKLQDLRYAYDAGVRLTSRADGLQPVPGGVLTERFFYDALDRLTCAAFGAVPKFPAAQLVPPDCALSLQYQPNGNIDAKSDVGRYAYDAAHPHAVAGIAGKPPVYGYDAVGNQTQRPGATIDYTAFDLPASIHLGGGTAGEDVAFDYDGNQRRVRKVEGGEETIYAGDLYEQVTDAAGDVKHLFFIGAGSATVVLTRAAGAADVVAYVHPDALGSVDVVSDGKGGVLERRSYDAFGARRNAHGWQAGAPPPAAGATALGFTGHEGDEELGLVNMRGRIYDPKVARFLQTDPIVSAPLFSQSWNPYSYVWNSPLGFTDPSGFAPGDLTGEDGVTYAHLPDDVVGPGPGYRQNADTTRGSGAIDAEQHKDAAQDDAPRQGSGLEGSFAPGLQGGSQNNWLGASFQQRAQGWRAEDEARQRNSGAGGAPPALTGGSHPIAGSLPIVGLAVSTPSDTSAAPANVVEMAFSIAGLRSLPALSAPGRLAEGAARGSLLRGTTVGYPGSPALQRIGVTPTTTDPVVAALFAAEASRYGKAVVLIAPRAGLPTIEGNVLASLEAEVGVELTPLEFAQRAESVSLDQARSALGQLGVDVPATIADKAALDSALRSSPRLTPEQIDTFLRSLGF